jgi:hypothetical protein
MIEWKEIPGFPSYFASSDGRIMSAKRNARTIRRLDLADNGYYRITLCFNGFTVKHPVHRLIALAWIGSPPSEKEQINHINGNKTDNRPENLEWCSHMENQRHWCDVLGKKRVGNELPWAKLDPAKVAAIRAEYPNSSGRKLAKKFAVNRTTIMRIVNNKTWGHVA